MDEFEDAAPAGPRDHPLIATLVGVAVLVLGALLLPRTMPQIALPALLGADVAAGVALWAIGLVATMRRSALTWKLGALAVLVVAGAGAALIAHGQYQTIARADASTFAEVEFGRGRAAQVPLGAAARGPLSKLFVEGVTADQQGERDFAAAMGKLGVGPLTSPYLLTQDLAALGKCDEIAGLATLAKSQAAARQTYLTAMQEALQSANLPAEAKQGIGIMAGVEGGDPVLENRLGMAQSTADLCRLLARRTWQNYYGRFSFANSADTKAFETLSKRRIVLSGQAERIARDNEERMRKGREMVRDVLARSIFAG